MHSLILPCTFVLLLTLASTVQAQTPSATSTIPPTATIVPSPTLTSTPASCPPPTVETTRGFVDVRPSKESYLPGDQLEVEVSYTTETTYDDIIWTVNVDYEFCHPRGKSCILVEMPSSCNITASVELVNPGQYPTREPPTPTSTPQPSPPQPIPEPLTIILFGTGVAALAGYKATRRQKQ